MRRIVIGKKIVGDHKPCYIIAEAGVNHNGDLQLAKKLVKVAAKAGADAVKFQTFSADSIATRSAKKAAYQKRTSNATETQYDMLRCLELSRDAFVVLSDYAQKTGIDFLSSPFDNQSVDLLESISISAYKIPSGEITNLPLLKRIAEKKKTIILSTGMATLGEIEDAFYYLKKCGAEHIILLHCTTSYPASINSVNLCAMETLRYAFQVPVGYSDHTEGITIPIAAVAMGACVLEKHFTLDRTLPGPDHTASLEPKELLAMVKGIRDVELAKGNGLKIPTFDEEQNKYVIRKSLVAAKDILKGAIISEDMINIKRPGSGIEPRYISRIIGSISLRTISKDELITWLDISPSKRSE